MAAWQALEGQASLSASWAQSQPREAPERRGRRLVIASAAGLLLVGARVGGNALWERQYAPRSDVYARGIAAFAGMADCEDTPGWSNGYWQCGNNGYRGRGCVEKGLTCEAYASNRWCQWGSPARNKEWAFGTRFLYPELNCCACGGGSIRAVAEPEAPESDASLSAHGSEGECLDTPDWANGFWQCKGFGCSSKGLACEAYEQQGWCRGGRPALGHEGEMGKAANHPELNCCACGGGSSSVVLASAPTTVPAAHQDGSSVISTASTSVAPWAETTAAVGAAVAAAAGEECAANRACAELEGFGRKCCPNEARLWLPCCDAVIALKRGTTASSTCVDTPMWTNGDVDCRSRNFTREQGCTAGGLSCYGYANQGLCANGALLLGRERHPFGGAFNHPELNCCVCGKK
jgi:hypothetical protein